MKRRARPGRKARALEQTKHRHDAFTVGLLSGCAAGLTVNMCLFPLNTVKTRLQARTVGSAWRSPTLFKGCTAGSSSTPWGAPSTGLFMATYEPSSPPRGAHDPRRGGAAAAASFTAPCDAQTTHAGQLIRTFVANSPGVQVAQPSHTVHGISAVPEVRLPSTPFRCRPSRCSDAGTAVVEPGRAHSWRNAMSVASLEQ